MWCVEANGLKDLHIERYFTLDNTWFSWLVAHWKDMLHVQFVDQNSKVNIQLNFGSKHTLQHNNDYHKDTHTC
jgi:hypothetical protein